MPIYSIAYNDYDEVWEICVADWDDESRVLNSVSMTTYGQPWPSKEIQTDYGVFVDRDKIEDAFIAGVRLIKEKLFKAHEKYETVWRFMWRTAMGVKG